MIRDPVAEFGALIEEVKFASDSPLEERRFEPSVPVASGRRLFGKMKPS